MKKKTRQVKAKRMWLCQAMSDPHYLVAYSSFKEAEATRMGRYDPSIPLFVLPATHEAWDAMVEQGAKALHSYPVLGLKRSWRGLQAYERDNYRKDAKRLLTALSLVRPTK